LELLLQLGPGLAKKHVFGVSQTLALCVGNHGIIVGRLTHNGPAIKLVGVAE
jgi:hypothetical protein